MCWFHWFMHIWDSVGDKHFFLAALRLTIKTGSDKLSCHKCMQLGFPSLARTTSSTRKLIADSLINPLEMPRLDQMNGHFHFDAEMFKVNGGRQSRKGKLWNFSPQHSSRFRRVWSSYQKIVGASIWRSKWVLFKSEIRRQCRRINRPHTEHVLINKQQRLRLLVNYLEKKWKNAEFREIIFEKSLWAVGSFFAADYCLLAWCGWRDRRWPSGKNTPT